jgi:hypothetical protein
LSSTTFTSAQFRSGAPAPVGFDSTAQTPRALLSQLQQVQLQQVLAMVMIFGKSGLRRNFDKSR